MPTTRRELEFIAHAIRAQWDVAISDYARFTIWQVADSIARVLRQTTGYTDKGRPRFDYGRFMQAATGRTSFTVESMSTGTVPAGTGQKG
jgi:hypothetical protein